MKVYLICLDAVPWGDDLAGLAEEEGLTLVPTINQGSYTRTSMLARFTGRMPSEVVPGGVGYRTRELERYYGWSADRSVSLFHRLEDAGWRTKIRNNLHGAWHLLPPHRPAGRLEDAPGSEKATWLTGFYSRLELSSGHPDGISDFYDWTHPEERRAFYQRERAYIRDVQSDGDGPLFVYANQAHWHQYRFYHREHPLEDARAATLEWLRMWDFTEPDALFWIFSDHGHGCRVDCPPPDYITWSLLRDNSRVRSWPTLMAGWDFYAAMCEILDSGDLPEGLEVRSPFGPVQRDRIYFAEDARGRVSPFESITGVAATIHESGASGDPVALTQLTWLRHLEKFLAFECPLSDPSQYRKIAVDFRHPVLADLRDALSRKPGWSGAAYGGPIPSWARGPAAVLRLAARRLRDHREASRAWVPR